MGLAPQAQLSCEWHTLLESRLFLQEKKLSGHFEQPVYPKSLSGERRACEDTNEDLGGMKLLR